MQPDVTEYEKCTDALRRAMRRAHKAGYDVGAIVVDAAVAADREIREVQDRKTARNPYADWNGELTSNRPGSWEAALLQQMIESGSY